MLKEDCHWSPANLNYSQIPALKVSCFLLSLARFVLLNALCTMSEDTLFNKAIEYIGSKEYAKALSLLNKGIEKMPEDYRLYDLRGTIYHRSGKPTEAVADYDMAISLQQNDFSLYYGRGMSLLKLKDYELALLDFEIAAELNPQYVEAVQRRNQLRKKLGIVVEEELQSVGMEKKGCMGVVLMVICIKIGLVLWMG